MRNWIKRRGAHDEGSLPMAMLITVIAMGFSATLVPVVVSQITSTRVVDSRTVSLDAAQSGLDVALGQMRAAGSFVTGPEGTTWAGTLEELPPCTMTGSQDSGGLQDTGAEPTTLRYRITVAYYGLPDNATDTTPVLMSCPPVDVPKTAVLTATGSGAKSGSLNEGSPGTRTISATYTFKTNNANITGGQIKLASPTSPSQLCMDSDSAADINKTVYLRTCLSSVPSNQRFAYTPELNIKLVGSETGTAPSGLCLDSPLPHNNGNPVKFQPCLGRSARQQWSLNDGGNFQGTSNGVALDSYCINLKTAGVAGPLEMNSCNGTANKNVFRPQPEAGAGMASAVTRQLVNYKQFSRCLDVTNFNPDFKYMIVWYCKQAPDGSVGWNQQWQIPPTSLSVQSAVKERIRTAGSGNPGYCLRTPTTTSGYVTMVSCAATGPIIDRNLEWVVYGDTGDTTTSYRIVDTNGRCLQPADLDVSNPDTHTDGTATVKIATCSASELQKWNAPPDYNKPLVLTNTTEK